MYQITRRKSVWTRTHLLHGNIMIELIDDLIHDFRVETANGAAIVAWWIIGEKMKAFPRFLFFFFVAVLFVEASATTCCRADKQQKKNQSNIDLSWHSGIYCDCLPIGHWYSLLNWFILMRIRQNIVINAHIAYIWKCLIKINYF